MDIDDLDIDLDVDGWEVSGGRSNNVWGQVPTKHLPIKQINEAISKGKRSCIWTCYDQEIYKKNKDGKFERLTLDKLPKTISATFKPCFKKYDAVCENLGMQFAMILDLPTSFNYIVKFDSEKYHQVIENFHGESEKKVQALGIVSIDFLQDLQLASPKMIEKRIKTENGFEWIETTTDHHGDVLVSFDESIAVSRIHHDMSGSDYLLKNWMRSLTNIAEMIGEKIPQDKLESQLKQIKSRIARSFLLREFLGDCDFTQYNSGFIVNYDAQTIRYAPNFDYGESFNKLVKTKLDFMPNQEELEFVRKFDPKLAESMVAKKLEQSQIPIADLAMEYSSDASQENLEYVIKNFPTEVTEFMKHLKEAKNENAFNKVIDQMTETSEDGIQPLSKEDGEIFKEYVSKRIEWFEKIYENTASKNQGK